MIPQDPPSLPSHHAEKLDVFGGFSDNNQQSHHFVLPEKGKFYTFVGCKVTLVDHAISQWELRLWGIPAGAGGLTLEQLTGN